MSKRPRAERAGGKEMPPAQPRDAKGAPVPDDIELWRHTSRSVTPLRKAKARVPEVGAPPAAPPRAQSVPAPRAPLPVAPKSAPAKPLKPAATPPPLVPIERRKARRIARGIVEIDDRIDLHGLRQVDAERRLRAFILGARAKGLRTVLVITGKGGERVTASSDDAGREHSARGVLRRSVPLWLETPELRECVAGIAPAHVRHGGGGALYIHLRKRR